jgi:hypothetical protein
MHTEKSPQKKRRKEENMKDKGVSRDASEVKEKPVHTASALHFLNI